ncbi:MAG: hypothetical protein ACJ762_09825 [Solirubrobacteraceae bacterium]
MDARTLNRLGELARRRGAAGFTFDDLAEAVAGSATDSDTLTAWLEDGRESGLLVDLGSETLSDGTVIGPQRFCLAAAAPRAGRVCPQGSEPDAEPRYWDAAGDPVRYR